MDFTEYRQRGKEMVDYIADYLENIRDRRVFPDVKPGYMKNLLPDSAPLEGEQWDAIFGDVERVIMPGITHWQSPHMHAYFPALNSFPSLLGDMLADAINCLGFTWASSPACTELEIIVMNWLGKMINLPDDFLHLNSTSRGGGVVQTTASEATLVCLLAGRTRAIQRFHEKRPGYQDAEINARLVAYCSDQAHSSVEKAALIGLVRMRYIEADENLSMRGQILREAIEDDIRQGLVPFWVCATLGTTGSCSFDNLEEIGIVCREFNLWLHVDAAYAGSAFICPEFRTWLKGIECADSIAFNPSKWLMIHFDATALWVKDSTAVHRTFNVEPLYLQHENSGVAIDYMHWQIPLSRRFRALKIWFVLRTFGIKGLQRHIREGVRLAQKFEALVLADHRFEIPAKRHLGLVVFRIKGENEITERLLKRLNHRGNLHCIPSSLKGKYVIRFTVTSTRTTVDDILRDWMEIKNSATAILDEMNITISNRVYLKDTKEKCEGFGSSLLLSNSPLSPKIVNGSFAALFDADEFLAKTYAGIRIAHQESPSMRRRVRGILMSGKQFSLDSHMDVVVQTSMNSHTSNSKMVDSYGKTTADSKNEDRNAICEDEEALEDCEMNWTLNTALQSNPINYLAVLNNQNSTPVDIIHRQNKLSSFLSKYATKYEVKNLTKSVNSVRTPLTQYQLYKNPRQSSITKEMQETVSPNLYPGKRYLNLDLTLHNDSIFTDTIFNLPTPTEEVIPIIITADTPTSSTKYIPDIEEPNKLHPLNSTVLLGASNNVDDFNKPLSSRSILIPIEETTEENNDLAKIVTLITTAKCNDLSKKDLCEIPSIPNYSSDSQELSEMNTPSRENIAATSSYISYTFSPKTFAEAWNDVQDLNKPLTSSSCLIPIAESIDETNDSSKIVSNFTNYISIETNVEDLSKFQLPIATFTTNLTSSSKSQKLVTTSSSIQNMNYISNSKTPNVDEELRELNGRKNMSTSILSTFLSNQKSFSDYLDRKESENETPTISNYFFTPNIVEGNNIEPTKSSTIISNIQFSNDSEDSPQFPMICSEDLSAASSNKNSIKCPIEIEKYTNNQSPKSSIVDESYSVFDEFNKLCNIPPVKSLTFADFSIFNKVSTENNIQPSKSLSIIEDPLLFKELHEDISISSTVDETSVNFNYLFSTKSPTEIVESATNIQLPTFLQVEGNYSVSEELNKQCSIQPTKSLTFTDFSMLKEISAESNIQPSNSLTVIENTSFFKEFSTEDENSLNFKDRTNENCMQTPKSSIEEVAAPTFVKQLYKEMYPKILNSKSKDNSSSSDEFLESVRQPSNDSEVLSSASSSLDIM